MMICLCFINYIFVTEVEENKKINSIELNKHKENQIKPT